MYKVSHHRPVINDVPSARNLIFPAPSKLKANAAIVPSRRLRLAILTVAMPRCWEIPGEIHVTCRNNREPTAIAEKVIPATVQRRRGAIAPAADVGLKER
jgi:hypothetical protein